MGIKGVNVFMALEDFDLTIGIVVDYMHCMICWVWQKQWWNCGFFPRTTKKIVSLDYRLLKIISL